MVLLAVGVSKLLAQAVPGMDGLAALVGNLGVVAVLVWHLWYITAHAQPRMLKDFADELEKIREARELERQASAKETSELRAMLITYLQGMRSAVHDVRDTAQTAINKVALEQLQKSQREETH